MRVVFSPGLAETAGPTRERTSDVDEIELRQAVKELTGPAENVLNDAYLVPDAYAEPFRAAVEEAVGVFDGIRVEVTGPWAPYSFAMPSAERRHSAAGEERG